MRSHPDLSALHETVRSLVRQGDNEIPLVSDTNGIDQLSSDERAAIVALQYRLLETNGDIKRIVATDPREWHARSPSGST